MPWEKSTCPSCGGNLDFVGKRPELTECTYCSSVLEWQDDDDCFDDVVDDRSYVEFDSVNIDFTAEKIKRGLKNADWYLEVFRDYTNAEKLYLAVANFEASNYHAWWGVVRAKTKDFSDYDITDTQRQELDCYIRRAIVSAPSGKKLEWKETVKQYTKAVEKYRCRKKDNVRKKISELQESIISANNDIDKIGLEIEKLQNQKKRMTLKITDDKEITKIIDYFHLLYPFFCLVVLLLVLNKVKDIGMICFVITILLVAFFGFKANIRRFFKNKYKEIEKDIADIEQQQQSFERDKVSLESAVIKDKKKIMWLETQLTHLQTQHKKSGKDVR